MRTHQLRIAGALASFLAIVTSSSATNWYLDNAAAGLNTGTSWGNAWTSPTFIVWGSSGVKAGDTLYISGGTTTKIYTQTWSVGASGTASNPIRIAIDASNPSHSGLAIFDYDAQGDTCTTTYAITCNQNYVIFDGNVGGQSHLVLRNLRNQLNRYLGCALRGSGSGLTVRYVAITNCNNGIFLSGTGNTVNHCQLAQIRGDSGIYFATSGGWDANTIYSNYIGCLVNFNSPPGGSGVYDGPDPIQAVTGVSMFGNVITETETTAVYTSTQHPDIVQCTGNYVKFYNNEIINIGDSGFDYDCYGNATPHDVWIYNNVYHITQTIDPYPEYFRFYTSIAPIQSFSNFKILNNTFVDSDANYYVIRFDMFNGNPTASGIEIKNNLFYNCGSSFGGGAAIINIANSTAFDANSFSFDGNIYYGPSGSRYINYRGVTQTTTAWIAANEPHGKTSKPSLVSYARFGANNDFHLQSTDTVAKDAGVNESAFFNTDFDGVARPQGAAWDIGAFEYNSGGTGTNPVIAVSPATLAFGSLVVGSSSNLAFTIQNQGAGNLSGTATVAPPFQIISDGAYNLASNASQIVTIRYAPTIAGDDNQTVTFTGGGGYNATVSGSAWTPLPGLFFLASVGTITSPFTTDGSGNVSQPALTGVTDGGRAAYGFMLTNAGSYVISLNLNAPSDAENSLFVNLDAEPQDPFMVWDIPVTSGFAPRLVGWRGNGTFDQNEFVPKVFILPAGPHQLIIRGREPNVKLQSISLLPAPLLSVTAGANSTVVLRWPSDVGRTYQLQSTTNLASWSDTGAAQAGTGQTLSNNLSIGSGMRLLRLRIY